MSKLSLVSLIVPDYDSAIGFYTEKLGFEVREDLPFGDERWVTLAMPGSREISISLTKAKTDDDRALVGRQGGSFPLFGITTLDCAGDYRRMKAASVKFDGEPESGPWGVGVTLRDPYGNSIFLSQEPA